MGRTGQQEYLAITIGSEFPKPETHQDCFNQFKSTTEQMEEMRNHLESLIDAFDKSASFLTRTAIFWGELPTWQRVSANITILGGLLTIGLILQTGLLCVSIAALALASGLLLDDHYASHKQSMKNLKIGILALSSLLESVISALDIIREQLAVEIYRFCFENQHLKENIAAFQQEMHKLAEEVDHLSTTESLLRSTQSKLSQVQTEFERSNEIHQKKIVELTCIKTTLELEVDKLQKIGSVLSASSHLLSATILSNAEDRLIFEERLETFLQNKTQSFDQIATRISTAEQENAIVRQQLAIVRQQLEETSRQYQALLLRQEHQVTRLEQLTREHVPVHPSTQGFFSRKAAEYDTQISLSQQQRSTIVSVNCQSTMPIL
jgi:hypothetical protein